VAPEAVKLAMDIEQTVAEPGDAIIAGSELVVMVTKADPMHPSAFVPSTEKVVLTDGVKTMPAPVAEFSHV
jgi:hypothetical protein